MTDIQRLVAEYVEKRLQTKRAPYQTEAQSKVDRLKDELGEGLFKLTERYLSTTDKPTLLGLERYCKLNRGAI